ncbi:MAG: hypothetical protein DRN96_05715 [Thermoproteota archaeon]|nr:MAG: hypothetical protein DRN96_05715 [Candidatus Korarchaeota archaeon]RLG53400.1 MAG: hypothetical protein DRN99_06740 [Candidatus Korarchaeota archaeon]
MEYRVKLTWDGETGCIAELSKQQIKVDTPSEFGGRAQGPPPEELLAASVGACYVTTLLYFARKTGLSLSSLTAEATCTLERGEKGFTVSRVALRVEASSDDLEKLEKCLKLTEEYCPITRMVEKAAKLDVEVSVRR